MKYTVSILLALGVLLCSVCYGHSSASLHYDDILCIFNGYGDADFKELCKDISAGIDNELPRRFRELVGPVPGNHRILGHSWTLNEAIPKETLEKLVARYPGKEKEVIEIWRTFARNINEVAYLKSGLPKSQANALASFIYDIHLLGDLEPDNKLIDVVLDYRYLLKNMKKDAQILFKGNPQYAELIGKRLDAILADKTLSPQIAAQMAQDHLRELHLGTMLNDTFGNNLKFEYSIDRVVTANTKNALRKMRDIVPDSPANAHLGEAFMQMMTPQPIPSDVSQIKVVKGVLREVENNGRKALVLELPFQFSVEQRAASKVAKELILSKGYDKLTPEFLESVQRAAKVAAINASESTGTSISSEAADKIAEKAVQWAQVSPAKAALKDGLITFVIMEGISIYRYYESDLSENELMFETAKNATAALAMGTATYCLVALGATPGGPIVIGVGIGLAMITDFAFDRMKEEFFEPGFSLDDIIGGVPSNIRGRRTIWEPGLDRLAFGEGMNNGRSVFEQTYKKGGINDAPRHRGNIFDTQKKNNSIFDSRF